jgi:dTMP kinase
MKDKKGKFIIVEGSDFSGKSTFIESFKKSLDNKDEYLFTREPGNLLNTKNANDCENIRKRLLNEELSLNLQTELFSQSRNLHTKDIVNELNKGLNVICDRYILSSFAYQAYAGDLGYYDVFKSNIDSLKMLKDNNIDVHVLVFKIDKENYNKRKKLRNDLVGLDVIEKKDESFFNKVSSFFNEDVFIDYIPNEIVNMNIHTIDANKSIEEVFNQGKNILNKIINN